MTAAKHSTATHGAADVCVVRRDVVRGLCAGAWLLWTLAVSGGCRPLVEQVGRSPLRPAQMSPDASVIEVFIVRLPASRAETYGALWDEIDEQHFPAALRQKLAGNGIRAGVVAGQVPLHLSRLLEGDVAPAADVKPNEINFAQFNLDQPVSRTRHQLRPGRRNEIACGDSREEMVLLTCDGNRVSGETFHKAQGILALQVHPKPDGSVQIRMTPELHHGAARPQYAAAQGALAQGMFSMEFGRSKRSYPDMAIDATLSPGHMVILSCLSERPESLGSRLFLRTADDKSEQKLVIVRLAHTQHDDLLSPHPEALPLDALEGASASGARGPKPDAQAVTQSCGMPSRGSARVGMSGASPTEAQQPKR